MPETQPTPDMTNPQVVHSIIAESIGGDVEKAMESVGWKYTDNPPEVPKEDNPPANTEPAKADNQTPADPFDQYKDTDGKYLGKYNSKDEMFRGMHSLIKTAKDALTQRDQYAKQIQELNTNLTRESLPRTEVTTTTPESEKRSVKLEAVLKKFKDNEGVMEPEDLAMLIEGVDEHSRMVATSLLQEDRERQQKEQASWTEVDDYLRQHHPDALKFVDEIALYVRSNPEVSRIVDGMFKQGERLAGSIYAWEKFNQTRAALDPAAIEKEKALAAAAQVRKEEVDKARKDAGLIPSSVSGVHETPSGTGLPSTEEITAAGREMISSGKGERWRALTIARDLKGPWFD